MIIKKNNQKNKVNNKPIKELPIQEEITTSPKVEVEIDVPQNKIEETPLENEVKSEEIDLFDIENIDFTQRQEKRRGSRRRGYRRIDDRNLISRAQEESENIKKSAFEEGYRLGLEKANSDIEKFRAEMSNFMNATKEVFEYIAPDILEISVNIAKTIVKKELDSDPQAIINTIIDILKTVSKSEQKITIRVKPQAVQFIKDTIPNITYQYGIDTKINIVSDPSIEDGGCILQTNNGIVDASVNTQIEIIKQALKGNI
jgi:flagellar assembly protein FliH